eukprot:gnl/TRDRNA2_/TRDRNA2_176439_c0_seq6.p1 gnl/TRDRNA2_/TRDRNA2_176439_c0~~gnl/TRDRNA2_/TRDRNA2_176439_c0_seq6.p1  ORF type:complete len:289 (+),score=38.41 gnl/TRDRNA2_/TRDRNA2_176439_c0_seq6:160-1026(+)
MKRFLGFVCLLAVNLVDGAVIRGLRQAGHAHLKQQDSNATNVTTSLRKRASKVHLRICNAYALGSAIDVFHTPRNLQNLPQEHSEPVRLTESTGPLTYKRCAEMRNVPLGPGSELDFRIDRSLHLGIFAVTEDVSRGSLLQVVAFRYDRYTPTMDFISHVFVKSSDPEIAMISAYKGTRSSSEIELLDATGRQREKLHYGTAATILPGRYLVDFDHGGSREKVLELRADNWQHYTAISVGCEAQRGPNYEEELIFYPDFGVSVRGSAARAWSSVAFLCAVVTSVLTMC